MLYIVLIPAWAWVTLLVTAWATLALLVFSELGFRHRVIVGLMAVIALQTIAASSTAIVTSQDPLNDFACLMGYIGMWVSLAISLAEVAVLIFLFTIWPRRKGGGRSRYGLWVSIWIIFSIIALLAHMRSTALCTV
ncbi:MAG: hypothetical protein VKL39_14755 [Leptolyngbyaceae bacterium]|nr:hypothetical protein [Leptolyngbyaceae bacterium]